MYLESADGYEEPKMASFYEVRMPTSKPLDIVLNTDGKIGLSLGTKPFMIDLKKFLLSVPVLKNKDYWVFERRWASVLFAELDTPLYFNKTAKRVCLLCDGKNTVQGILKNMVFSYPEYPQDEIMMDTINFIYLLKKFRLMILKNN